MIKTEKLKSKDKKKDKLVKIKSLYNSDKVNEQPKTIQVMKMESESMARKKEETRDLSMDDIKQDE